MIFADSSWAKNLTSEFDKKHKLCLEQISKDTPMAFEMAMIWQENRDKYHYEWQGAQNEATRKTQLLATALGNDGAGAADNWSSTVGSLLNSINNATYGAAKD